MQVCGYVDSQQHINSRFQNLVLHSTNACTMFFKSIISPFDIVIGISFSTSCYKFVVGFCVFSL